MYTLTTHSTLPRVRSALNDSSLLVVCLVNKHRWTSQVRAREVSPWRVWVSREQMTAAGKGRWSPRIMTRTAVEWGAGSFFTARVQTTSSSSDPVPLSIKNTCVTVTNNAVAVHIATRIRAKSGRHAHASVHYGSSRCCSSNVDRR